MLVIPPVTGPGSPHLYLPHTETLTCKWIPLSQPLQTYRPYSLSSSCLGLLGPYCSHLADPLVSLVSGPDLQMPWYLAPRPLILLTGSPVLYSLAIACWCTQLAPFAGTTGTRAPLTHGPPPVADNRTPICPQICSEQRVPHSARQLQIEFTGNTGQTAVIRRHYRCPEPPQ